MLGFVQPVSGKIFVGGKRLRYDKERLAAWRKQVTLVSQDSLMFKRTLRENICYGVKNVIEADLQEAIRLACLEEWIASLPEGLETVLQGREKQLSGGQRQRVQLCRAFLQNKQLVFLVSFAVSFLHCFLEFCR